MALHPPINPFRAYNVQKVLPAVYDDSLSYYELLCKMQSQINEVTEGYNSLYDAMVLLQLAWQEFEQGGYLEGFDSFVEQWFLENQDTINQYLYNGFAGELAQLDAKIDTTADGIRSDVADDYVPFPTSGSKYGTIGQVLSTDSEGGTSWVDPVTVTSDVAEPLIQDWLDGHPEATTTVQDGSITTAKLADGAVTDDKLAHSNGVLEDVGARSRTFTVNASTAHSSISDTINYLDVREGDEISVYISMPDAVQFQTYTFATDKPVAGSGTSMPLSRGFNKLASPRNFKSMGLYVNNTTSEPVEVKFIISYDRHETFMLYGVPLDGYLDAEPHFKEINGGSLNLDEFFEEGRYHLIGVELSGLPDEVMTQNNRFLLTNVVLRESPYWCYQELVQPYARMSWHRFVSSAETSKLWFQKNPALYRVASMVTDFDDFTEVGDYFVALGNQPNAPSNAPSGVYSMSVSSNHDGTYVSQKLTSQRNSVSYVRGRNGNDGWTPWVIQNSITYPSMIRNTTVDLNTMLDTGLYSFSTDTTIDNAPYELAQSVYSLMVVNLDSSSYPLTPRMQVFTNCRTGETWLRYITGSNQFYMWRHITSPIEEIPVILSVIFNMPVLSAIDFTTRTPRTLHQDIAVYDGDVFQFDQGLVSVNGGSSFAITNGHGNNANFGVELHGDYPYLYCPSWTYNDSKIYVNQVTGNSSTLVRTIEFSTLAGHMNAVVDEPNDTIYILQNIAQSTTDSEIDFITAKLSDGTILSTRRLPFRIPVIQGMCLASGAIYVTHGGASPYTENHIKVLNTNGDLIGDTEDISGIVEIEGMDISDGTLYVAGYSYLYKKVL